MKHKSGFVNIIGNPNVGKSTLMNTLIGQKLSITTNKVQTTRHRIKGILNGDDYQIVFSDTPGFINPSYKLQESMMNYVYSAFKDADILIYMVEPEENKNNNDQIFKIIKETQVPLLVLINKIDLYDQNIVEKEIKKWSQKYSNSKVIPISALNNFNISNIKKDIIDLLPISPPYFEKDAITDKSSRFFVEEIIREKILIHYKKEIPYSVQIQVEDFIESEDSIEIRAVIYVMRESQKGIIIGHRGLGLKRIGSEARKDIEKMLGKHIYLHTPVKVKKNWRKDTSQLKKFGYQS